MSDNRNVSLISLEGESFQVPVKIAIMSEMIKSMVDIQDEDESQEIPLPNVKSSILAKVIEYMTHYEKEPMYEIEKVIYTFILSIFIT